MKQIKYSSYKFIFVLSVLLLLWTIPTSSLNAHEGSAIKNENEKAVAASSVSNTGLFKLEVMRIPQSGLIFTKAPRYLYGGSDPVFICQGKEFQGQLIQTGPDQSWISVILPEDLVKKSQKELLKFDIRSGKIPLSDAAPQKKIEIKRSNFTLTQQSDKKGGFPSNIKFVSGHQLNSMDWGDRLFDNNNASDNKGFEGAWTLTGDKRAELKILSDGPVCTAVRQTVKFIRGGANPPSNPFAVYDWFYFKTKDGLIRLQANYQQAKVHDWKECHFFEFHIDDGSFPKWLGANRQSKGAKVASGLVQEIKAMPTFNNWGAFVREKDFIAVVNKENSLYSDPKGKRIYIHADRRTAWNGWRGASMENSCLLLIGTAENSPGETIGKIAEDQIAVSLRWNCSSSDWRKSLLNTEQMTADLTALSFDRDGKNSSGDKKTRSDNFNAPVSKSKKTILLKESADLAISLSHSKNGSGETLALNAVADKKTGFLFSQNPRNLFFVLLEDQGKKRNIELSSLSVWKKIIISDKKIFFKSPVEFPELANWMVTVGLDADPSKQGFSFDLQTAELPSNWRAISGTVGGITLENTGSEMTAIYPGGSGTIVKNAASSGVSFHALYPSLGAVMAWTAVWDQSVGLGLYIASHDPTGGAKKIKMNNSVGSGQLNIEFEYPLPLDPKKQSAATSISGKIVWKTFSGDWYDATRIYRDWVRINASWFPELGPEGRVSTPDWMKRLCVWGRVYGTADNVVPIGKKFREVLGIPVGIHWYVWHQIPFDNDYPHYLPAKEGFAQGVKDLQRAGCYVVPYTNGHLWDTRDRENEDWQFSSVGKAGACKHADGSVFTESYRSKEKDGSKVILAAMCPGSKEWKSKIAENVKKIAVDNGLNGVYMDQISCVGPIMCEDPHHGHSLRGGSWWVGEYKKLLLAARAAIPKDRIFSSESNSETYADVLEGMVCWHIESENTVPAFSTIYSGVVFQYGRSYDSNVRAMLMKWGQELVYGEQLGWFPPEFMQHPDKLNYFRPLIRFRYHNIDFFYKGEGVRPPKLKDPIPAYTEDWNIFGRFSLNTVPIVQTGARRILHYDYTPNGKRIWNSGKVDSALLIFTNYSKENAKSRIELDWKDLGFDPKTVKVERVDSEGVKTPMSPDDLSKTVEFPPMSTWGIILHH